MNIKQECDPVGGVPPALASSTRSQYQGREKCHTPPLEGDPLERTGSQTRSDTTFPRERHDIQVVGVSLHTPITIKAEAIP